MQILLTGEHGVGYKPGNKWQLIYRRKQLLVLDSFGPSSLARGNTTPKQAMIYLRAQDPQVPHVPVEQIRNAISYDRRVAMGPGVNTDHIIQVLRTEKYVDNILYPIFEKDFPNGDNDWQIIVSSKKLLGYGAEYSLDIVGLDSRWKNTDLRRPLTLVTGVCRGISFPIAVMISNTATIEDFCQLITTTSLEIELRTGIDWDPIFMIDKDNAEKGGVQSRRSCVNSTLKKIGFQILINEYQYNIRKKHGV